MRLSHPRLVQSIKGGSKHRELRGWGGLCHLLGLQPRVGSMGRVPKEPLAGVGSAPRKLGKTGKEIHILPTFNSAEIPGGNGVAAPWVEWGWHPQKLTHDGFLQTRSAAWSTCLG